MRPYTGTSDGAASGRRPGLEEFVRELVAAFDGRIWNNGTYGIRPKRGASGLSVHATGRAVDLSRRAMGDHRRGASRDELVRLQDWLVDNADRIGLELLLDYEPAPYGRGWKCDRAAWQNYTRPTIGSGGAAWADWIHVELDPEHADRTGWIDGELIADLVKLAGAPSAAPLTVDPWPTGRRPIRRGSRSSGAIRLIQGRLDSLRLDPGPVDGIYGPRTEAAVLRFQRAAQLEEDGIVGPITWAALFGF